MKTFTIGDTVYTDKQLASAIKRFLQNKDARPLNQIMADIPPEGDAEPVYREVVLAVHDDPVASFLAAQKLERGVEGFGSVDPFLNMAEFLVNLYLKLRRRK